MDKTISTTIPVTEPPYSALGLWGQCSRCLTRAFNDTLALFAWHPGAIILPTVAYATWVLINYENLRTLAWPDLLAKLIPDLHILIIVAAFVLFVFALYFASAPYRSMREENAELRSQLGELKLQASPAIEIGYSPDDCNSVQGDGSVGISRGGKWQMVNLADVHMLRLRCTNPTGQDIPDCSGYVRAVERFVPESQSWKTIWHDAVSLTWSLTAGETHTTIPAKANKYLDVAYLSANDLPVLKTNAPPFDLYRLFHLSGLYRLVGSVSSAGRAAAPFEMTLEYTASNQQVVVKMGEAFPPRRFPTAAVLTSTLT